MKLPINNCRYISPSTFAILKNCMLSAWIQKWSIEPLQITQTPQMAIGSAVDSFIKAEIAQITGESKSEVLLAELLKSVSPEQQGILGNAKTIADDYINQGLVKRLLDEGDVSVELNYKNKEISGVPVYCKPDAFFTNGPYSGVPIDWKVNGYKSKYGGKVCDGWHRKVVANTLYRGPFTCPMEQTDPKWADQLWFYWEVINNELSVDTSTLPRIGHIEQICIKPSRIEFVTYRSEISHAYILEQTTLLKSFWNKLSNGEIDNPLPCTARCHPYGHKLICTSICPAYNKTMGPDASLLSRVMYEN